MSLERDPKCPRGSPTSLTPTNPSKKRMQRRLLQTHGKSNASSQKSIMHHILIAQTVLDLLIVAFNFKDRKDRYCVVDSISSHNIINEPG